MTGSALRMACSPGGTDEIAGKASRSMHSVQPKII
jgi:hypothetical protein